MCGSVDSWVEEGWKPFADLGRDLLAATQREETDADEPLRRAAKEPSVSPGVPLS